MWSTSYQIPPCFGSRISANVDSFIPAAMLEHIIRNRELYFLTLQQLGFTVNLEKPTLQPSPGKTHTGFFISTVNEYDQVWIRISHCRIIRLRHDIQRALSKDFVTARGIASIAAQCFSMSRAIVPAKLLLHNLCRLHDSQCSWQRLLVLDQGTATDLKW